MVNHHVPAHPAFGVADESTPGPVGVEGNSGAPICDSAKAAKIARGPRSPSPHGAPGRSDEPQQTLELFRLADRVESSHFSRSSLAPNAPKIVQKIRVFGR